MSTTITSPMAVHSAFMRMNADRRSGLELLPNELKLLVINHLGHTDVVVRLALTGPTFFELVVSNQEGIVRGLINTAIGPELLPIAVAHHHVAAATAKLTRNEKGEPVTATEGVVSHLDALVRHCITPGGMVTNAASFEPTFKSAGQLLRTQAAVSLYANCLSERALTKEPRTTRHWSSRAPKKLSSPSVQEIHRFSKALYILQLVCHMFPIDTYRSWDSPVQGVFGHFWVQFAPRELQQVRCLQTFLVGHVEDVVNDDENEHMYYIDTETLTKFVINRGLVDLYSFEARPSTGDCRRTTWHTESDGLYLRNIDGIVSLDVTEILDTFHEDGDTDPQDSWLHTLSQGFEEEEIPMLARGAYSCFHCEPVMTNWAFVFWGRDKLEWQAGGRLPTTAELQEVLADQLVEQRQFSRGGWGRKTGIDHDDYIN
ncbi:Uu.00g132950.m01.CDS01 [Anthostomella pinea]|uniref:Uu.00g132950.m01.CDS01 n=1 Tax=Anthostomella pinea TaxID=933095 RepID=A0AAI8VSX7_9PEZI|nr:Uu.00g132950.m01.CDS01 [Anthostomella pinea]